MANKSIEETKPWVLSRERRIKELSNFIGLLVKLLKKVAESIDPFMPETACSIIQQISADKVEKGNPLFPRLPVGSAGIENP